MPRFMNVLYVMIGKFSLPGVSTYHIGGLDGIFAEPAIMAYSR